MKANITQALFITGTDTDIGKTFVTTGLLRALGHVGLSTLGTKPVATGCHEEQGQLVSADVRALAHAASFGLPYSCLNPFAFSPPLSPHLAAQMENVPLSVDGIVDSMRPAFRCAVDFHLIEGIGGWLTPVNEQETMADFVIATKLPVILVVGVRLGCINHALLTYQAMKMAQVDVLGWMANCLSPSLATDKEVVAAIARWLPVPLLGTLPYQAEDEAFMDCCHQMLSLLGGKKI